MDSTHPPFEFTLPPQLFAQAFPFHFVLDKAFHVIQAGHTLQRLIPDLVGDLFQEQFEIQRPKIKTDFLGVSQRSRHLFLLKSLKNEIILKGQMVPLFDQGIIFFLGSPIVRDLSHLKEIGLKLRDFAIYDPITDFLLLLQTKDRLMEELEEQSELLRQALREKEEIAEKAEQKARERASEAEQALKGLQEAQVQLIQTEKMSALGQMLAGIAHEINNPINFIGGNLRYVDSYSQDLITLIGLCQEHNSYSAPPTQQHIEDIELDFLLEDLPQIISSLKMGVKRIKETVVALRNFSRSDDSCKQPVDLHDGLNSTLHILSHKLKLGVEVVKEYGDIPIVDCYPAQLNQVFMNVLSNAADALLDMNMGMDKGRKTIHISTDCEEMDFVRVRIQDNGPGIPEEVKSKVFEPFFTTKGIGKGTGLGLSICSQIIEKHRGTITVNSLPGEGTTFTIRIPRDSH